MLTYKDSGVDTESAKNIVDVISPLAKKTFTKGVIQDIGLFSGLFKMDFTKYKEPILVSGTDGVGTKLKVAFMANKHNTVGIDLVAMSVNDIITCGAEPLFFLDYIAINKIIPNKIEEIVSGIAEGCKISECALIGGETAEMPSFYNENEYDIAGFAVGVVDKEQIIDGKDVRKGDCLIGIRSSGFHSNGYSLLRKVFFDVCKFKVDTIIKDFDKTVSDILLEPTRIYVKELRNFKEKASIKAIAHITGGGIIDNVERVIPNDLKVKYDDFEIPEIFKFVQKKGEIEEKEMFRTFNMGIGLVLITDKQNFEIILKELGNDGIPLGEVVKK